MNNAVATGAEDNGPCCDKCGQHKKTHIREGWNLCVDCWFSVIPGNYITPNQPPPTLSPPWVVGGYPGCHTITVTPSWHSH